MRKLIVTFGALAALACADDSTSLAHTPTRVVFLTEPASVVVDSAIRNFDIGIVDNTGTIRTDATSVVTITVGTNPPNATLSGTTTVNAVHGIATFSGLSLNHVGNGYTLVAESAGLTPDTSSAFNVTP